MTFTLRHLPFAICVLMSPLAAQTAESPPVITRPGLSLRDALTASLRDNPALRVNETVIEQRSGFLDQTAGAFDWNTFATVAATENRTPLAPVIPGSTPTAHSHGLTYTAGVSRLLRNGVVLRPNAAVSVDDQVSPVSSAAGRSSVNFEILVPLLRGLGRDSTGAVEAAARGDVKVAKLLYQHALSTQAFNTAVSYWSSRAADDAYLVQRDVERSAARLVESTKVLVDSRIFPPAYLLQAEANLREKRTVRINAELESRSARFTLGQQLGLAPEQIAETPAPNDGFPPVTEAGALTSDAMRTPMIRRALVARADYVASQESLVPLNLLARQAQIDLKPRLDLTVSAGYRGLSNDDNATDPLRERMTGGNGLVGLSLDWPFNNSYQRGLLRERRANIAQVEAQTIQLSQLIAGQVLLALEQVRLRADAVRSAQDTVDLSKRALAAQYEQLKTGDGTILDVISLENISSGARIRYINAHASYATALAQLRFTLGLIFKETGIAGASLSLEDLTTQPAL
ncbi:TolC family protein [Rariglobus hedericola]|uniref:TolC family protein n=1 Tax=Rariglobus hedericola TaxID=2597822 RepID=A0A556QQW3_9BACT|nr:TolC family protein [Rariglobus hedericola]TSJ79020.1 TolC family protein [Rariglobus hedericola]